MTNGYLSKHFIGIAGKILSTVEANKLYSNQHEFHGIKSLKKLLGCKKTKFKAKFIYLNDKKNHANIKEEGSLTWYDSRENHSTRSEFRLYFTNNKATSKFSEGDLLLICKKKNNSILVVVAAKESIIKNQLLWLFDLSDLNSRDFSLTEDFQCKKTQINPVIRQVLEKIEIPIEEDLNNYLELIFQKFPYAKDGKFPKTNEFSKFTQTTVLHLNAHDDPDEVLLAWIDREEVLFRALEEYIIKDKLKEGFKNTDEFIRFSLSVLNRRKSRAGHALENHLEQLLIARNIKYSRNKKTEARKTPDFIFPNIECYQNETFDSAKLNMLALKSTCKERWRQILAEAQRIKHKHLLTLQPSISEYQIEEMKAEKVQLVIPRPYFNSFKPNQLSYLMSISSFFKLIIENQ